MSIEDNDHVQWLRRQAGNYRKAAGEATDEKKRKSLAGQAERLSRAAAGYQLALSGLNGDEMGGHLGLIKRLMPGTRVIVRLVDNNLAKGEIRAMGRYDFALLRDDGNELVIPKHAVVYWILEKEEDDGIQS